MWIIVGGRQTRAIVEAIREYHDTELEGVEMVEDVRNKNEYGEVKCITILDAGLSSLKDWQPFKRVRREFDGVDILLYTRYPDLTPEESALGDKVRVFASEKSISISDVAKRLTHFK